MAVPTKLPDGSRVVSADRNGVPRILPLLLAVSLGCLIALTLPATAQAAATFGTGDGLTGCTSQTLSANDDGSSALTPLGFTINFFGRSFNSLFVNNNGNVTFDASLSAYRPLDLTSITFPIIAAFFGDVDTRGTGSGLVTYGSGSFNGRSSFCVNWFDVGYFSGHVDKTNRFQLVIQDRADTGSGNFDIYLNYDRIAWDSTDTSTSAGVGYSGGMGTADTFFQLAGSLTSGAFLDSNASTGLVHRRLSSSADGRLYFTVRDGRAPIGKTLSGTVTNASNNPLAGAPIGICPSHSGLIDAGAVCTTTQSDGSGRYSVPGLAAREYVVIVNPPASANTLIQTNLVVDMPAQDFTQNAVLTSLKPKPARVNVISTPPGLVNGAPRLLWGQTTPISVDAGVTGFSGTFKVVHNGQQIASGRLLETPPGSGVYAGALPDMSPTHGPVQIITDVCSGPDGDLLDICPGPQDDHTGWIDPSGNVRTVDGKPVNGATVSLFRSDSAVGPFALVPDGSAIMSPSNRHNPDTTLDDGRFAWDVTPGFYKVRAAKAGCVAPDNANQAFVETAVLPIPPPVTGLDLRLSCPAAPDSTAPTTTASVTPAPGGNGFSTGSVTVTLAAADNNGGSGVKSITYSSTGAAVLPSTTLAFGTVSFVIGAEGQTTVTFFARDNANNTESQKTVIVKLDKGAPAITIVSPTATSYFLNDALLASYSCADGAGVVTCAGPVSSGSALSTATLGARVFTVNASDTLGNNGGKTVNYSITYKICLQYNPNVGVKAGSSIVIKLQLCDAANVNMSGAVLTTLGVTSASRPQRRPITGILEAPPDDPDQPSVKAKKPVGLKFNAKLKNYSVSVSTKTLAAGTYALRFTAPGDPVVHSAPFKVLPKKPRGGD